MEMPVLAIHALVSTVGVIIELRMTAAIENVAFGIMLPFCEITLMAQHFGHHIMFGGGRHRT